MKKLFPVLILIPMISTAQSIPGIECYIPTNKHEILFGTNEKGNRDCIIYSGQTSQRIVKHHVVYVNPTSTTPELCVVVKNERPDCDISNVTKVGMMKHRNVYKGGMSVYQLANYCVDTFDQDLCYSDLLK